MTESEEKALNYALNLLGRQGYFSTEIEKKLLLKGYSDEVIAKVIAFCKEKGYLSDQEHLKRWIESAQKKGFSKKAIAYKLKQKGVKLPGSIGEEIESEEEATLRALVKKQSKKMQGMDEKKRIAYLARKGFSLNLIFRVNDETKLV